MADPDNLRFFVDESALGIGKTLAAARTDVVHAGHPLIPECPLGAFDTDWIPEVAKRDLVVIARDKRLRTRPQEMIVEELIKTRGQGPWFFSVNEAAVAGVDLPS